MLFCVSGIEINPVIPFLVAFSISFFTSMCGVSGAFLLLPFQVSYLGYTTPSVSATNHVYNVVAIPSGVYRYVKEGRMLWPLTWAVISATLPGVFIGAWIRILYLPSPRDFKLFVGLVLFYIGGRLFRDLFGRKKAGASDKRETTSSLAALAVVKSSFTRVSFKFQGETYHFSPPLVYALCFLVGIIGGVYGIGGGAIVAPFFVAIVGLPVYVVAGAALMGTCVTSIAGVIFYHLLAQIYPDMAVAPDWPLGLLFGAGGSLGIYLGARTQKYVPAKVIKGILTVCVLFIGGSYILGFLMRR